MTYQDHNWLREREMGYGLMVQNVDHNQHTEEHENPQTSGVGVEVSL